MASPRCTARACPVRYRDGADRPCAEHRRPDGSRELAAEFLPEAVLAAAGLTSGRTLAEVLPDPAEAGRVLSEAIDQAAASRGSAHGGR